MSAQRPLVAYFGLALIALSGCASNSDETKGTVPVDQASIQRAEAATTSDDLSFATAETVDATSFGLVGDGVTDNTAVFKLAIGNGNRTIRVPAGDYVTGKLVIPSNTIIQLEPGVTIRDSGQLAKHDRLINIHGENVRIEGLGARIVSRRSDYLTDEWRHGVHIFGAKHVVIDGLESSSHGGDGFYIGGPPGNPSTDIVLRGCRADNNRRQGLSITSARRVRIVDCEFVNTNGTAPQFGVDLEPNDPVDFIDDIVLLRPHTRQNRGGGIMVYLNGLNASSHPVDVTIIDHLSQAEARSLDTHVPPALQATVRYSRQ